MRRAGRGRLGGSEIGASTSSLATGNSGRKASPARKEGRTRGTAV